jgi:tellurite resistance protein
MPRRHAATRSDLTATIAAARRQAWGEEMLDAFVTAAALVARADNWVQPIERNQLLDFLDRVDLLAAVGRDDIAAVFERCMRELREPLGIDAALNRLSRVARRSYAPLMLELAEEVAAADCRLDPREREMLDLIRATLDAASLALDAGYALPGKL